MEDKYIVLNRKIHQDTKGNETMDLTLFDLSAENEQKAVLSLSVKEYTQSNRTAQDHEIDHARKLLKDYRESVWADDLNS